MFNSSKPYTIFGIKFSSSKLNTISGIAVNASFMIDLLICGDNRQGYIRDLHVSQKINENVNINFLLLLSYVH